MPNDGSRNTRSEAVPSRVFHIVRPECFWPRVPDCRFTDAQNDLAAAPVTVIGHRSVTGLGGEAAGPHPGSSWLWLLSLLLERLGDDGQVVTAEPLIDDLLPFVGHAGQHREPVIAGRL